MKNLFTSQREICTLNPIRFLTGFTFLKAAEKRILGDWCQSQSLRAVRDMPKRVVVEISSFPYENCQQHQLW